MMERPRVSMLGERRAWRALSVCLFVAILALFSDPADACAVCFGEPDSAMTQGINKGIMVLLGVVAVVQVFFVALFFSIRQRARKIEQHKNRFQVLQGGAN